MLNNALFFFLVLFGWFLYAHKCAQFVTKTLQKADYSFLNILCELDRKKSYSQLLLVQLILFLPISLYSLAVIAVAFSKKSYGAAIIVLQYDIIICLASAWWYLYHLQNRSRSRNTILNRIFNALSWQKWYWVIFIRYLLNNKKLLLISIKLYDCAILYLFMRNLTPGDYDITLCFMFYSFGLLGHGVFIHQLREFEEVKLAFYRGLPFSLFKRFVHYVLLYFILLIPEIITIGLLTWKYLHFKDAIEIILCSYSILLLLNSLLFIAPYKMIDYLKTCLGIFCIVWFSTFVSLLSWLPVLFFGLAIGLFLIKYYKYEISEKVSLTYNIR